MKRIDDRKVDELRKVKVTKNFLKHPTGSVLIENGNTRVIKLTPAIINIAKYIS